MLRTALLTLLIITSVGGVSVGAEDSAPSVRTLTLGSSGNHTIGWYLTALSRNGKELAYRTGPTTISVFEPLSGKQLRTVTIDEKEIGEVLHYSPDGRCFIFQAMQQWRLIGAKSGITLRKVGGDDRFDAYAHEFHWTNDCTMLIDVQQQFDFGFKPKVKIWNDRERKLVGEIDVATNGGNRRETISGDGSLIATTGRNHRATDDADRTVTEYVELWDTKTQKRTGRIHLGKEAYAVMLELNADGKYLLTVTEEEDGAVIWNTATQKPVAKLGRFPGGYGRVTFSPDDKLFAIQSATAYTLVYETATGKKIAERQDKGRIPAGVGFTEKGDILACYVDQGQVLVSLVNREKQPELPQVIGHTQPVVLTRFADDGKTLLTVGQDGKVLRWNTTSGALLETVIDDPGRSRFWDAPSTFSPDGKLLVTASSGSLSLYHIEKKRKIADLRTATEKYYTRFFHVAFTDDFTKLIAHGEGQENRDDFQIVIGGYVAAWNTADGSLISEFAGRDRNSAALVATHYGDQGLAAAEPPAAVEVIVGPAIRDPWASPQNVGPTHVGNQLTLKDRKSGKVLLDRVVNSNNGRGVSASRDGQRLAIPLNDGAVQILTLPQTD